MLDFLVSPLTRLIMFFFEHTGSFGLSILLLTVVLRLILLPLSGASINMQKKMRILQPKLKLLEKKHSKDKDKTALRMAQMELYREHKINPLGGLLPAIVQFVPLIAVYQVLQRFLSNGELIDMGGTVFLGFDLTTRDTTLILPIIAAGAALVQSLMILPGLEQHDLVPEDSKSKKVKKANEQETKNQDAAGMIQKQMVYTMPVITGIFAAGFPAGLALYWIATTIFGIAQQYLIMGWGGMEVYLAKVGLIEKASSTQVVPDAKSLAAALSAVEGQKTTKSKTKTKTKVGRTSTAKKSISKKKKVKGSKK